MIRSIFLVILLAGPVVVGCADSNLPETAPVKGKVTFQQQPLSGGTVTFHPQGQGNPAFGEIQPDGTFRLTTYKRNDGAVLGKHLVTIEIFAGQGGPVLPGAEAKQSRIPSRYGNPKTSGLEYEAKKGTNEPVFDLKP